jgi:serine/threonine protein kinase/DNA-binding winged helix-turn-helix (wHTH) protein
MNLDESYLDHTYQFAGRKINPISGNITFNGRTNKIRRKELETLALLLTGKGKIITRQLFIEYFWNDNFLSGDSSLTRTMAHLRATLQDTDKNKPLIRTIRGRGYQLNAEVFKSSDIPTEQLTSGMLIEGRPSWKLIRKLDSNDFTETWLAHNFELKEKSQQLFRFCNKEEHLQKLRREIKIMRYLRSTLVDQVGVITIINWQLDEPPYYLEIPNSTHGSLVDWIESQGTLAQVDFLKRIDLLIQIANALAAIHAVDVVHRNIGSSSIYIDEKDDKLIVKIGEFGLSDLTVPENLEAVNITLADLTLVGDGQGTSSDYLSPERLQGLPATKASDVYAFGILIYQILVGGLSSTPPAALQSNNESTALVKLISACTDILPENRPKANNIIEHLCELKNVKVYADSLGENPSKGQKTINPDAALQTENYHGQIDAFRLLDVIGEGGMGKVYLAEQREPVYRKVALKLIKLGMDSELILARFESERQAMAMMSHNNIASIFQSGKDHRGRPYFVMEYVPGLSITQFCDQHHLTLQERIKLFLQVCSGVLHAHQKGIIHRDLNPSNILVKNQHDEEPLVKIIDFGIAKSLQVRLTPQTLHTSYGSLVGTPQYSSPEQLGGQNGLVDIRADIYSLGIVLYELLVGVTPYKLNKVECLSPIKLIRKINQSQMPTPNKRLNLLNDKDKLEIAKNRSISIKQLTNKLNLEISWIIFKCTETNPNDRYGSVILLKEDLHRWLKGLPVKARKTGNIYKMGKLIKRKKAIFALSLISLMSFMLSATIAMMGYVEAIKSASEAKMAVNFQVNQLKSVSAESLGELIRNDVIAQLGVAPQEIRLDSINSKESFGNMFDNINFTSTALNALHESILSPSLTKISKNYSEYPLLQASLFQSIAEIYFEYGLYNKAQIPQNKAIKIRSKTLGKSHSDTAFSYYMRSYILYQNWSFENALNDIDISIEGFLSGDNSEKELLLNAYRLKAGILIYSDNGQIAIDYTLKTIKQFEDYYGNDSIEVAKIKFDLAFLYKRLGIYDKADSLFNDAIKIEKEIYGTNHPKTLWAKRYKEISLMEQGKRFDINILELNLKTLEKKYGSYHYKTIEAKHEISHAYYALGKKDKSKEILKSVINYYKLHYGPENVHTLNARLELIAEYQLQNEEYNHIERDVVEITNILELNMGPKNIETINAKAILAKIYLLKGNKIKAKNILSEIKTYFKDEMYANHRTKLLINDLLLAL